MSSHITVSVALQSSANPISSQPSSALTAFTWSGSIVLDIINEDCRTRVVGEPCRGVRPACSRFLCFWPFFFTADMMHMVFVKENEAWEKREDVKENEAREKREDETEICLTSGLYRSWPQTPESAHHLCGASRFSALRSSILLERGRTEAKVNGQPPPRRPGRKWRPSTSQYRSVHSGPATPWANRGVQPMGSHATVTASRLLASPNDHLWPRRA